MKFFDTLYKLGLPHPNPDVEFIDCFINDEVFRIANSGGMPTQVRLSPRIYHKWMLGQWAYSRYSNAVGSHTTYTTACGNLDIKIDPNIGFIKVS